MIVVFFKNKVNKDFMQYSEAISLFWNSQIYVNFIGICVHFLN